LAPFSFLLQYKIAEWLFLKVKRVKIIINKFWTHNSRRQKLPLKH
jgi:hypothetical protein